MHTHRYFEQAKGSSAGAAYGFANADVAFVLAYSVIMLNTDLYNDQVWIYDGVRNCTLMCFLVQEGGAQRRHEKGEGAHTVFIGRLMHLRPDTIHSAFCLEVSG